MLISLNHVEKSFDGKTVLKDVDCTIEENRRYGLIGVNGAGKSTLLNIIDGTLLADDGEVFRKNGLTVGYLKQNSGLDRESTILAEMRKVFSDLLKTEQRMRVLENEMALQTDHNALAYKQLAEKYARLQSYFESQEGYQIDVKIKMILNGMGFMDKDLETSIQTLSGGEKTRLAIARLLLEEPQLLILDEPTNHLDFKTLNWLEEYLISYRGALLIVSHDRYFLDKVVDNIYEAERGHIAFYKGNYSKYVIQKQERRIRQEKEYEAQQVEIAKLQTYVDKNIARASTANSAKSRLKILENMEIIEKPDGDLKRMKLRFEKIKDPYKDVLTVEDLTVSVGEEQKVLCTNVSISVKRGEKIAIIGENGIGKSSFLKTIQGLIPHSCGEITWGKNVSISYYEQENLNLNADNIALDELWDRFPHIPEAKIRRTLGSVLLTQDDVYKPVKVISGGERAKLAFCILMLEKSNVLILDEPTNHLDLSSKEILETALNEFDGTVLFVSHDRYLLNRVPDKIVEFQRNGIKIYTGCYDDYLEQKNRQAREESANETAVEMPVKSKSTSFRSKEQRRLEVQLKNQIKEVEAEIERLENENILLEEEMAQEQVYTDYQLMAEKTAKMEENLRCLEDCYANWEELQKKQTEEA